MNTQEQENETLHADDLDYLVFSAKEYLLALPCHNIIQIVDSPSCTAMPNMPRHVRGVIDFMDEAIPLIDTRIKLSVTSRQEEVAEFVNTFMLRKQDHLNWIDKLKDAVNNDKDITVEKNPHKCAFGKWYDAYEPSTLALSSYMKRFDKPHQAIHYLAVQAEEMIKRGQKEQAKTLIYEAENSELKVLVGLFDGFEEQMELSYQEYAVIVAHDDRKFSLSVDSIKYFEKMDEIIRDVPFTGNISGQMIHGIGRKKTGGAIEDVIILNLKNFLDPETVAL